MDRVYQNLKATFRNFTLSPQNAIVSSYPQLQSNETSAALIFILAIISGLGNILFKNYLPVVLTKSIVRSFSKESLAGLTAKDLGIRIDYFKCFFTGFCLFLLVLAICSLIAYFVRTYHQDNHEDFFSISKLVTLSLIPSVIFLLIADIAAVFSAVLFFILFVLSIACFVIYFYQCLCILSKNSYDKCCYICSISFVIILFILGKLDSFTGSLSSIIR